MGKIAEVIKYEGDNSTFVWKHPLEDFNSLTQLIVHESQEALFMMQWFTQITVLASTTTGWIFSMK